MEIFVARLHCRRTSNGNMIVQVSLVCLLFTNFSLVFFYKKCQRKSVLQDKLNE